MSKKRMHKIEKILIWAINMHIIKKLEYRNSLVQPLVSNPNISMIIIILHQNEIF